MTRWRSVVPNLFRDGASSAAAATAARPAGAKAALARIKSGPTIAFLLLAGGALAQPRPASPGAAAAAEVPTDVRRITLIVRDIPRALALYEGVLGLKRNYDAEVTMSGVALPAGEPGAKARLVLLQGKDPWIGWIGLMQWLAPPLPDPGPHPTRLGIGGHVIVLNVDDAETRCAAGARLPGVTMTAPARLQTYPGRDGAPPIRVMGCNLFDGDGTFLEINQLLR